MASTNRLLTLSLLAIFAIVIAACNPTNNVQECGASGVLCPQGTHCAAAEGVCIPDEQTCGNAKKDEGEACDDGNTIDTDGCNKTCSSTNECGNGMKDVNVGEVCDDGNTRSGDGCSADCKSDEKCGNRTTDLAAGEVCDDGNTKSGDGCDAECKSREICGNGITDEAVGEVCDEGPDNSDAQGAACSTNCRSNLSCNNKIVDAGEECDAGAFGPGNLTGNSNTNDCRADCQFNRCGDGFVNAQDGTRKEACDGGHLNGLLPVPTENNGCDVDCTLPVCNDGIVNRAAGEQCDDQNNANNDGCSSLCKFERCGNGIVDPQEECDGTAGLQPCNVVTCFQERCGNGVLDDDNTTGVHEQCDDHNTANNDGCSSTCVREFCGDGKKNNGEVCDATDPANGAAGCNTDCTLPDCGDGKLNLAANEQCDDGNETNGDGCSSTCKHERCGNGVKDPQEQCDGLLGLQPCNNTTCLREICGNGILDTINVNEQCDDANTTNGDGCSSLCVREFCGDGKRNNGEACDRTDPADGAAGCNTDCTLPQCGDGKLNLAANEQCDDQNLANGDGCSSTCKHERCGNGVKDPQEQCDGLLGLQPCNNTTCLQEICGNGILDTINVSEQCDDNNTANNDGCSSLCVREFCGDNKKNNGEACDPTDPVFGAAGCNTDCTLPDCGDGKLNLASGEQCDDGNESNGDGCSAICKHEQCGNGVKDPQEQCDGLLGLQPCNTVTCLQEICGNGIYDNDNATGVHEECDDNNTTNGDGCSSTCKFEFCGDLKKNNGEACDPTDPADGPAACNIDCTLSVCPDGKANLADGEDCDDGNTTDGDGCDSDCSFTACGNGIPTSGEGCDDGNSSNTDSCTNACTVATCGDLFIQAGIGETCDDGNVVTETCAYALVPPSTPCNVCDSACHEVPGVVPTCGDSNLDLGHELCEDNNLTCGACNSTCDEIQSAKAIGTIFAGTGITPGQTLTVTDGLGGSVTITFIDADAPTADTFDVRIESVSQVATGIRNKLVNQLQIEPTVITGTGIITLIHKQPTSLGNGTVGTPRITTTVTSDSFAIIDMHGGLGGDCDDGEVCSDDIDCASQSCVGGLCAAVTPIAPVAPVAAPVTAAR